MTTKNESLTLRAEPRETTGKRVRFLRREGQTPANLYGRAVQSVSLQLPTKDLERALAAGGRNALLTLTVDGTAHRALLRSLQRHPLTRAILHAEFYKVEMDRPIETQVPIHLIGEAPAARLPDSVITQVLHTIEIECLPGDIPTAIEVDLSKLVELETAIVVRDVQAPPGVTILTDPEQSIVRAAHARVAEEVKPAEEAAEGAVAPAEGAPKEE